MAIDHFKGADGGFALAREISKYGVDGSANIPALEDTFPPTWTETFTAELIRKSRGRLGLQGDEYTPVVIGSDVSGDFSGPVYFDSTPQNRLIMAGLGREIYGGSGSFGGGTIYSHIGMFGSNVCANSGSTGQSLLRHGTLISNVAGVKTFTIQSVKPSSVQFSYTSDGEDAGLSVTISATGYKCTRGSGSCGIHTGRETGDDFVLSANQCTANAYIREYATSGNWDTSDQVRLIDYSLNLDQQPQIRRSNVTEGQIEEPIGTTRMGEGSITVEYGTNHALYGKRDLTGEAAAGTKMQLYIVHWGVTAAGHGLHHLCPCVQLTGPAKIVNETEENITVTYDIKLYKPEDTFTGFWAMGDFIDAGGPSIPQGSPYYCCIYNDRPGYYLAEENEAYA